MLARNFRANLIRLGKRNAQDGAVLARLVAFTETLCDTLHVRGRALARDEKVCIFIM